MRKHLWIGLLIALICLYFAFRDISFRQIASSFESANPGWVILAVSIYLIGYLLRSLRWKVLMEPVKDIPTRSLFAPMIIGFLANNILPFRMGEIVRAHMTGKKFDISRTASLGTILLERLFDTVSFLTTFVAIALFFPFPFWVKRAAGALGGACGGVIIGLIVVSKHEHRFHMLVDAAPLPGTWKRRLYRVVSDLTRGVSSMTRLKHVAAALSLSLIIWIIEGTILYLIARALHVPLGYPQSFFLLFFLGLSVTLPQAPGYVGTMELFGTTALTVLKIPKGEGLALVLAIHGFQFCFIILMGSWALWKEGLSIRRLAKMT